MCLLSKTKPSLGNPRTLPIIQVRTVILLQSPLEIKVTPPALGHTRPTTPTPVLILHLQMKLVPTGESGKLAKKLMDLGT